MCYLISVVFNLFWALVAALNPPQVSSHSADHRKNVVLVHGIWDSDLSMLYLRRRLEKEGYRCITPALTPNDARLGLDDLSRKLKNSIDAELKPEEKFSLVAFSMGGLVSRNYLLEHGGLERCERFITISTPHNGTWMASWYPGKGQGVQEMRPGSDFLNRLRTRDPAFAKIPCYSYRTPLDLIILPSVSSNWPIATNRVMVCLAHPLMLLNSRVAKALVADLKS
jgi:triacylglycerol lipase